MSCAEQRQKRWRKALHGGLGVFSFGEYLSYTLSVVSLCLSFSLRSHPSFSLVFIRITSLGYLLFADLFFFFHLTLSLIPISHTFTLFMLSFFRTSTLHLALYFSCAVLKAVDQRRNVYRRRKLSKSNRRTPVHNTRERTFSGSTCCEQLGHAASRAANSPDRCFFGIDEARRVTATSSHEIQSTIFVPDRRIFEGRPKRPKSIVRFAASPLICNSIATKARFFLGACVHLALGYRLLNVSIIAKKQIALQNIFTILRHNFCATAQVLRALPSRT